MNVIVQGSSIVRRHSQYVLRPSCYNGNRRNFSLVTAFTELSQSIGRSSIVQHSMTNLINLHEWSQLPWFAEIALVTITARCLVAFPLAVNQRKILLRYEKLKPEIMLISRNLKRKLKDESFLLNRTQKSTQKIYTKALSKEVNRLIVRDNCHPIKATMVAFFQIPMWITLSHSYRNLARVFPHPNDPVAINAYQQLQQEGIFWFHNLTVPDPMAVLPIATALINLTIIQLHVNERKRNNMEDSLLMKIILNGSRVFSVAIIPIGLVMPADMSFYWFVSSSIGLVQNILLMNPKVKQYLGINNIKEDAIDVKSDPLLNKTN